MLYIVDASVYVFRAYYSIPDDMTDDDGNPVNAVYGFSRFLGDMMERSKPEFMAAAFDVSLTSSFRNDIYPEYKANRDPAPPELKRQFGICRDVTRALGIPDYADSTYEADDLIGSIVTQARDHGLSAVIVTRDKDLAQLLGRDDQYWDYAGNKRYRYEHIEETFGVRPERVADFLALTGDSVDNIPGVPGIGKKTASVLMRHFDTLDDIYAGLDEIPSLKLRGVARVQKMLVEHRDTAYMAQQLTRIACDAPVDAAPASLKRRAPDLEALFAIYDDLGFGQALRRQAERLADVANTA